MWVLSHKIGKSLCENGCENSICVKCHVIFFFHSLQERWYYAVETDVKEIK